ncbi:MAG TPA: PD-(D/E)XK nuclease family protein, partial [Thermoanaerobaculia bacterium]|nr:PD-(D/E)XK nuclease family protein [Thermoanaerobaculia bacterium]
ALAAARKFSGEGSDFARTVEELSRLRSEDAIEEMGIEPGRPGAVRLMTLHGAKGLEAPVVILAEPAGRVPPSRDYFIERETDPPRGHFRVARRLDVGGDIEIARPPGWDAMQDIEKRFDDAEHVRLLYVGATRAMETLVVTVRKTGTGKPTGPWAALSPFIEENLPQAPGAREEEGPALVNLPEELEASRRRRAESREESAAPGYAVASVTAVAHSGQARPARERTGKGMSWGSVIHRLLEALMRDGALDLRAYAANVLAEEDRPPEDLEEAVRLVESVRASALWKRAMSARRRFVEVTFALNVPSADVGVLEGPPETLLTGAIDLAFEEDEGWFVVDYKSDTVAGGLEDLVAFYSPQVAHYRRYWEELTGRPTKAGLFFVATGQEVWL